MHPSRKERRKKYFNDAASTWDEKFFTPELVKFLENLIPNLGLKPRQNILDLGTGTCILIPFLLQTIGSNGSVTAIDYAEKMDQICRSKYSQLKNVIIILRDLEEPVLPSESFDAVICFGLFPHLEDKERVLYHMFHVLKRGGKLIIAHALSSAGIKAHHDSTSLAVINDVLPEKLEMRRLLNGAGFVGIYIKDESGFYLCKSKT